MSPLVNQIVDWQKRIAYGVHIPAAAAPPPSTSHVLLFGCVDARINTRKITRSDGTLLFPDGKSPVRNIAARIVGPDAPDGKEEAKLLSDAIERDHVDRI